MDLTKAKIQIQIDNQKRIEREARECESRRHLRGRNLQSLVKAIVDELVFLVASKSPIKVSKIEWGWRKLHPLDHYPKQVIIIHTNEGELHLYNWSRWPYNEKLPLMLFVLQLRSRGINVEIKKTRWLKHKYLELSDPEKLYVKM